MMKINELPPLEYLKEILELDPSLPSGLRWKLKPPEYYKSINCYLRFVKHFCGKMAGFSHAIRKYFLVFINYNGKARNYRAHRIVYSLYHNIDISNELVIDHIDRNPKNNKIENLRLVSQATNSANKNISIKNKSGVEGVFFDEKRLLWSVSIGVRNKNHSLGSFVNFDDAVKARKHAEKLRDENLDNNLDLDFKLDWPDRKIDIGVSKYTNICRSCFANRTPHRRRKFCYDCYPKITDQKNKKIDVLIKSTRHYSLNNCLCGKLKNKTSKQCLECYSQSRKK